MDDLLKFGDSRSSPSRDIGLRLPHFVTEDEPCGITTKVGVSPNKKPVNWWGKQNATPLKFDPKPSDTAFSDFDKCRP